MVAAVAGPYTPPNGVLVELPSGERVDVPFDELELVSPTSGASHGAPFADLCCIGAEVRLRSGSVAKVVDFEVPARFLEHSRGPIMRGIGPGSRGSVRVELASGEQLDVPAEELESVPHSCRAEPDAGLANWLVDAFDTQNSSYAVGQFVPRQFAAVARILHRWQRRSRDPIYARWSEVAAVAGVADVDALSELRGDDPNVVPGFFGPADGEIDVASMDALVPHLRRATQTPNDVLFAIWEGWGDDELRSFAGAASVLFPAGRRCGLLRGSLDAARSPLGMPGWPAATLHALVWWPTDHAWVVYSDIDWPFSLLAGSAELIAAVSSDPELEATPTTFDADW
jgi:hypothetical protein